MEALIKILYDLNINDFAFSKKVIVVPSVIKKRIKKKNVFNNE
jgi:hypothetical protein